jgi:probable phosphoglycerate mutase
LINYLCNFPSEYFRKQEIDDDDDDDIKFHNQSEKFHIKIFSSPFIRAVETADILLNQLLLTLDNNNNNIIIHPEVIIHDDLRERNFGIFELKSDHESYSKVWKMDESKASLNEYKEIKVESCEEVRSRMCNVINEIEQQQQQSKLLAVLVSHGDSLQILQTAFENVDVNLHRSLNHLKVSEWRIFGRKKLDID